MPKMPKVMELPTHIWFQISNVENPALRGTEIKQHEKVEGPFILRKPLLPRFSGVFQALKNFLVLFAQDIIGNCLKLTTDNNSQLPVKRTFYMGLITCSPRKDLTNLRDPVL